MTDAEVTEHLLNLAEAAERMISTARDRMTEAGSIMEHGSPGRDGAVTVLGKLDEAFCGIRCMLRNKRFVIRPSEFSADATPAGDTR